MFLSHRAYCLLKGAATKEEQDSFVQDLEKKVMKVLEKIVSPVNQSLCAASAAAAAGGVVMQIKYNRDKIRYVTKVLGKKYPFFSFIRAVLCVLWCSSIVGFIEQGNFWYYKIIQILKFVNDTHPSHYVEFVKDYELEQERASGKSLKTFDELLDGIKTP